MFGYSKTVSGLINAFSKMPGIGKKSAERLAFYVLEMENEEAIKLADLIKMAKEKVGTCSICKSICEGKVCEICANQNRKKNLICVVEETKDILAIERSRTFKGSYHVLGGRLAPLDGIGPEDLNLRELVTRVKKLTNCEVIIATASDSEGEATASFLSKLLKPYKVRLSRIAYGIPTGTALEYADSLTLSKALEGRRVF